MLVVKIVQKLSKNIFTNRIFTYIIETTSSTVRKSALMASKKREQTTDKIIKIGRKEIREYQRGKRYYVRWSCLYEDESGNAEWRWTPNRTVHGKKAEAESEAERYRQELEKLMGVRPLYTTLGEYADKYQEERREEAGRADSRLSPLTVERDEIDLEKVKNRFGSMEPTKITAGMIIKTYRDMREEGESNSSIHKVHAKLSAVIDYAIGELCRNDPSLMLMNPCSLRAVRNEAKRPKAQKQEALTQKEAANLVRALKNEETTGFTAAVWLALFTGMRRGEVLGLTWGDIDFGEAVIHIRVQYAKDKKLRAPKSDESQRDVAIDPGTVDYLKKWKDKQAREFNAKETCQTDSSPVCSNSVCNHIDPDTFGRWRRGFFVKQGLGRYKEEEYYVDSKGIQRVRRSGYEGKTFHCLRHTQATLLFGDGKDVKTVQGRLGHSDANLTLNTYAHTITEKDREAAYAIAKLLNEDE